MRIDRPDRTDVPNPSEGNGVKRPVAGPSGTPEAVATRIGEETCKAYIQKASACEEVNLQAIAEAKKLIESGQLDTPEAINQAAERIISIGI
ncbi:MAG: hypothetical protein KAV00_18655 [Phycisphaerae bacterium]|nr:hypothetical protein [Phycisphaerae bacterium]